MMKCSNKLSNPTISFFHYTPRDYMHVYTPTSPVVL